MTDPPAAQPERARRKVPIGAIIAMLVLGGPALAFGGCMLFMNGVGFNDSHTGSDSGIQFGMLAVLLGALIFVGGLGWGVVVLLMSFFRENK